MRPNGMRSDAMRSDVIRLDGMHPNEDSPDPEQSFTPDPSLLTVINNRTILAAWNHALQLLQLDIASHPPPTVACYLAA